ncbi:MAG: bifunctional folylpolyglutamate synthase/dihydrofolate synthase [Syntrophorhabdaceae bacterium]|nr:bifunctional folylpolyglutamate synthase/dihydrofolate synthase [Syntrophorhabdaceae bacterium]
MAYYSETLNYLYSLEKSGILLGLDNIRWILGLIGNPHESIKTIHIGGTNGKGSVATIIETILMEAGYRVGKYTSPHLISFTERIRVDGKEIGEDEVVHLTGFIREKVEKEDKGRFFTFFDFTTALAFEYFRRKKTDIGVIEVGLGGRLDSTNVIKPLLSVITNVAYDHMDYLGDDISSIAREKAGIIKEGIPLVTGVTGVPKDVIEETCSKLDTRMYLLHRDFEYKRTGDGLFTYKGLYNTYENLRISLMGDHQIENGAVALCAIEILGTKGFPVGESVLREALGNVKWPGRLEVVRREPLLILDGAHNVDGAITLSRFISNRYRDKKKILIFGVMKDKDYRGMLEIISSISDILILTRPDVPRALDPREIGGLSDKGIVTGNIKEALTIARSMASKEDLIVVTGSFFTIGEAKKVLDEIF